MHENVSGSRVGMQDGGALMAKGVYGCIFKSTLQCKPHTEKTISAPQSGIPLTKMMLERHARAEMAISKLVHRIDGWDRYFAVPGSICVPSEEQSEQDEADMDACPLSRKAMERDKWSSLRILSMTYRGKNLNHYAFDLRHMDFRKFCVQLLEAGAQLALHRLVHRDLHSGNVVVDKWRPRIIDFNLAVHVTPNVSLHQLLHQYNPSLHQESPDTMLINALEQKMNGWRVLGEFIKKRPTVQFMMSELSYSHKEMTEDLARMYSIPCILEGDVDTWFHTYWYTMDSWSIGMLILSRIRLLLSQPAFLAQYTTYKTILRRVLRQMCDMNPDNRIDCVQALARLDPKNHVLSTKEGIRWMSEKEPPKK
jgi:serine/threonine protein kinase